MSRTCPNCSGLIHRFSRAATCCWPCGMEWRALTPNQKARKLDEAAGIFPQIKAPPPLSNDLRKILIPSASPNPAEIMEGIFGPKTKKEK